MKLFLQLMVACFFFSGAQAQRVCITPENNLNARRSYVAPENATTNAHSRDTTSNEIITIPVVIHLLFNSAAQNISDEQILSQITALNNDYRRLNADAENTPDVFKSLSADTRIMFCLAQVDPTGRASRGIIRKHTDLEYFLGDDGMKFTGSGGDDAWDPKKYLNIWVCNMFGRALGYATAPGAVPEKDGVVINYDVFGTTGVLRQPFDKGRTATHEVGHWLGLKHLWGDESCGTDDVDDTPRQLSYNFNCPAFPHVTSCSVNGNGDMFMNYMDLTNDACMNMFTYGQATKMRSLFATNGSKNSFLNSYACDSSLATGAPLPDDTLPVVRPRAEIKVYPNPVRDIVTLSPVNNYELTGKVCTVFNMAGMKMFQQTLSSEKPTVDLSRLAPGVYVIMIGQGGDKRMLKVIKI
ncbi:MAG: M43 family zinc metalloprotease [Ferruginibacter sp.]